MKRELIDDMLLFNNDLREYKVSIEGKFVLACYDMSKIYHNETILEDALKIYWQARNGDGLHWTDDEEREKAKEFDNYIANLYRELN